MILAVALLAVAAVLVSWAALLLVVAAVCRLFGTTFLKALGA